MPDEDNLEAEIRRVIREAGFVPTENEGFFNELKKYAQRPLNQIIDEETGRLIAYQPGFFSRYDLEVPRNPEVHLFDRYYPSHGKKGLLRTYHATAIWFAHLGFFLIDDPQDDGLAHAVEELKKIFAGTYLSPDQG